MILRASRGIGGRLSRGTRSSCEKAGVFTEMRRREHYEKPTEIRKRKAAAARKREQKKLARMSMPYRPRAVG